VRHRWPRLRTPCASCRESAAADRAGRLARVAQCFFEQVHETRRKCSAFEPHADRLSGSSMRNTHCSPSVTPAARAHSAHTWRSARWHRSRRHRHHAGRHFHHIVDDAASGARRVAHPCASAGAAPVGGVLASSALACEIAASGLRISCAMPADTRPSRRAFPGGCAPACCGTSSRTARRILDRLRLALAREAHAARSVRCAPGRSSNRVRLNTTSRPASGHEASRMRAPPS